MRNILSCSLLFAFLISATPASARYKPVLQHQVPRLQKKQAVLYVVRPCKVRPAQRGGIVGKLKLAKRLLPGDKIRVAPQEPRRRIDLIGNYNDVDYIIELKCLSHRSPGYSFRKKMKFERYLSALVEGLPDLAETYVAILKKHNYELSYSLPGKSGIFPPYERSRALTDYLNFVRFQIFPMAYSGRGERSVLRKESDWITNQEEDFIRIYSGDAPDPLKKRLKKIYLLMNKLNSVTDYCGLIRRTTKEIAKTQADQSRYPGVSPSHRARLIAEDVAKLHSKLADYQTRLSTNLATARAGLMTLGLKP